MNGFVKYSFSHFLYSMNAYIDEYVNFKVEKLLEHMPDIEYMWGLG